MWTFCAAAGYTRPNAGPVEELLLWVSIGESGVSRSSHTSSADSGHRALPDSILTLSGPFSAVASCGNLSHRPHKWVAEDLERLKSAGGTMQVRCEQGIWWRLEEKLRGAESHSLCPRLWCVAAGCSPALSNATPSTLTFRLNWRTFKPIFTF